jgi:hypothetical protein
MSQNREGYLRLLAARSLVRDLLAPEAAPTPPPGDAQSTLNEMEQLLRGALRLTRAAELLPAAPALRSGVWQVAEHLAELLALAAASSNPALEAEKPTGRVA